MTPQEILRWGWTVGSFIGVALMFWNLREALVDNWAVHQVRTRPGLDTLRLLTRGDVWDHGYMLAVLLAMFLAGVAALLGQAIIALVALIAAAVIAVVLSFVKTRNRRRVFSALRLGRMYASDPVPGVKDIR